MTRSRKRTLSSKSRSPICIPKMRNCDKELERIQKQPTKQSELFYRTDEPPKIPPGVAQIMDLMLYPEVMRVSSTDEFTSHIASHDDGDGKGFDGQDQQRKAINNRGI